MQQKEAAFVYCSYQFGDENAVPTGKTARVQRTLTYKEALSRTIIFTSTVLIDTQIVDRELILMPDIPSEDTATWWRILQSGIKAWGLDELFASAYYMIGWAFRATMRRVIRDKKTV